MLVLRLALVVVIFVVANVLMLAVPRSMAAERVGGEAYGLAVGSPPVTAPGGAYVQLPPAGGSVSPLPTTRRWPAYLRSSRSASSLAPSAKAGPERTSATR